MRDYGFHRQGELSSLNIIALDLAQAAPKAIDC